MYPLHNYHSKRKIQLQRTPLSLSRGQQYLGDAELGGERVEAARDGL